MELNLVEATRLKQCEAVIEHGLKTFVDVGTALLEIRDSRLYRNEYATFEDYCRDRWGWVRQHVNRLIASAEVMSNLEPTGSKLPETERQARPLTQLEPEQQREAWQRAVDTAPDGKVTGAYVQQVVDEIKRPDRALYSSDSTEWYTPNDITFRVLLTLGEIDLDPCSNSKTEPRIPAKKHYTIEDDGLSQFWSGNVYMNPPYGNVISDWVGRIVEDYQAGTIDESILLVPSRTDTAWFRLLRDYPHCFIWGRLKFSDNGTSAPFPSMAVYLGKDTNKFYEAFSDIGDIYVRFQGTAI